MPELKRFFLVWMSSLQATAAFEIGQEEIYESFGEPPYPRNPKTHVYLAIAKWGGGLKPFPKWFMTHLQWIQTLTVAANTIIFHLNLPWFPSEYHPRVIWPKSLSKYSFRTTKSVFEKFSFLATTKKVPQSARKGGKSNLPKWTRASLGACFLWFLSNTLDVFPINSNKVSQLLFHPLICFLGCSQFTVFLVVNSVSLLPTSGQGNP